MKTQVLISTMNQNNHSLLDDMLVRKNGLVINQTKNLMKEKKELLNNHVWINSDSKGLSKSRNIALNNAFGEICIIGDDDLVYVENFQDIISESFLKNPNVDIIAFQVEGIEKEFKKYTNKKKKINYVSSMKISSVEIAFKLNSIKKHDVSFDEDFGSGSKYIMGEENIFLFDCLRKKMKVLYIPIKIADLHINSSSWFKGYDKDYFTSKGAVFFRLSAKFSTLLITQFAIRKYNLYKNDMSFFGALFYMFRGRKIYIENQEGVK